MLSGYATRFDSSPLAFVEWLAAIRWVFPDDFVPSHRCLSILQDAIAALNSLQSNFSIVEALRKAGRNLNKLAIPEMIEWCQKLGYQVRGLPSLFLWEYFLAFLYGYSLQLLGWSIY